VIEVFGASSSALTLSEVARRSGLTRATARRYLLTLARLGYAEFDGKLFSLAPRVLRLGYGYLSTASLPKLAQPVLETIGERTREVASIAILDGTEIAFLAHSANRRILSATFGLGTRLPAYCTAMGRVLLASWPDADVERFLKNIKPQKMTPMTKTARREILSEVIRARANGYSINDQEIEMGLSSIAVPVADSRGGVKLAMSVSLQSARMTTTQMIQRILPVLKSGSHSLSAML